MGYTKLFSSIVTSTIWMESDTTRIVWITMLAMADKNGEVQGSVPGLARLSGVDLAACEAALKKFMSPDPHSRTTTDEGRRIEKIDGGWEIINHAKYRALASKEDAANNATERKRRSRARQSQNVTHGHALSQTVTQNRDIAEAEADALNTIPPTPFEKGDDTAMAIYDLYPRKVGRDAALKAIRKRIKDGIDVEHLKARTRMFSEAVACWPNDDLKFVPHPATWFNAGHFDDDPSTYRRGTPAPAHKWPKNVTLGVTTLPDL